MCLRLKFCTYQRVCIIYFLKKSQIRCTLLYIEEIINLQAKGGKRPGGSLQPPKKKMKTETRRQDWVENPSGTAVRLDSRGGRGGFAKKLLFFSYLKLFFVL
jgi:hypothetical protein